MRKSIEGDVVERLEGVACDRQPFTDDHKHCICRLTNAGAREITRLRSDNERLIEALKALAESLPSEDFMRAHGRSEGPLLKQMRAALSKALGEGQEDNG